MVTPLAQGQTGGSVQTLLAWPCSDPQRCTPRPLPGTISSAWEKAAVSAQSPALRVEILVTPPSSLLWQSHPQG